MTTSGFTLLEMLIVILIMGLFVGMAAGLTRPDDRALLRVEAARLAQLLDLAATKARLGGRSIAWTADAAGYRFWQFSEDTRWSEIRDDDSFRARALPQGMAIYGLRVENAASPETMRLEFGASGATPSFALGLSLGAARSAVTGSPIGEMRASPEEETADGGPARR
jgi:general secretion pathway protein H